MQHGPKGIMENADINVGRNDFRIVREYDRLTRLIHNVDHVVNVFNQLVPLDV